jgi:4-nitrophenyl phosphatase
MDGVLYRGRRVLPGARAMVAELSWAGTPFALVTNNSTRTPGQYQRFLASLGMRVPLDRIVSTSVATVAHLRQTLRPGARVVVIGEAPLRQSIARAGFAVAWEDAAAVVVGLDRHVTYAKLTLAMRAIARGAQFIASNPDPLLPTERGVAMGAGSLVAALQYATGREPLVLGKPRPYMLLEAMARIGTRPGETAMVGDQISTDIAAGRAAGMRTILVQTGVSAYRPRGGGEPRPDLTVQDLRELRQWMTGGRSAAGAARPHD